MQSFGLVLAGGGVAGIAWHLGVLTALHRAGVDLAAADVIIGTSAGATAGAQLATGVLTPAAASQLSERTPEIPVEVDPVAYWAELQRVRGGGGALEQLQRIGAFALAAITVPELRRRAVIAARLPIRTWPASDLRLVAVDVDTGETLIWHRQSGVDLVDAVAASCAVPGIWPTVALGGRRCMDGGVRSLTNADLAAGCDRVVVLVPSLLTGPSGEVLAAELASLPQPVSTAVISAEGAAAAFTVRPLDPATRGPAFLAGTQSGGAAVGKVKELMA